MDKMFSGKNVLQLSFKAKRLSSLSKNYARIERNIMNEIIAFRKEVVN